MWKCSNCGETVEDSFEVCWSCERVRGANDLDLEPGSDSESNAGNPNEENVAAFLTRSELGAIISRVMACVIFSICIFQGLGVVILFLQSIVEIPWSSGRLGNLGPSLFPLLITFGLIAAMGLFFWMNAKQIGRGLVGGDKRQIKGLPSDLSPAYFGTTIQVVGLVLVVDGLRQFISIVYFSFRLELDTTEYWDTAGMLNVIASLGLGAWMLLGSNGIVKGITWLRTVGTPLSIHPSDTDSPQSGRK